MEHTILSEVKFYRNRFRTAALNTFAITILAAGVLTLASTAAAQGDPHHYGARVMSHLPLDTSNFQNAVYRENGVKRYLYVQNKDQGTVTVIDVSHRRKSIIVGSVDLPKDANLNDVNFQGDVILAKSSANEFNVPKATAAQQAQNLVIWDISKPGSPKAVKQFHDVKKTISGSGNVDYILDADGLWTVQVYSKDMRDWDDTVSHDAE